MEEIRTEFINDAEELIEKLFQDIERLRAARSQGRERRELVARIFRYVHTLKGSAASHAAPSVSEIAHEFENVLDGVRLGRVTIDHDSLNAFESAASAMAAALSAHARGKTATDSTELTDRLRRVASERRKADEPADVRSALPEEIARALSEYDQEQMREAVEEGARLFIVSAGFEIDSFDQSFRELSSLLGETGEVICTVPALEPAAPAEINFRLLYVAESTTEVIIEKASALGRVEFFEIALPRAAGSDRESSSATGTGARSLPADAVPGPEVRVGLNQLDDLISDASELFRDAATALGSLLTDANREEIDAASFILRRRFVELEERLIRLRLVPVAQMLERAAMRAGRFAARDLGKDVEFEIVGGDLCIDRSLADLIADPLLHLVRNAISHGIESPEERLAAGKSVQSKVKIAAFSAGSHVHISVTDDGRGINRERVAEAAAGVVGADSNLSMEECLRLIFRPGFSTAEALSDVSGRGIGLDVVDRAMADAGGEVRVTTAAGAGTTFEMILPATLALLRCVMVRAGGQSYGIESARVTDRGAFGPEQIKTTEGVDLIEWKGAELPLVRLRALLGQADSTERTGSVLVVQTSNHRPASGEQKDRIAVMVDSIEGEHETLVRSLGRHAARWRGVGGATELLDGSVALVLDLEQLMETAR